MAHLRYTCKLPGEVLATIDQLVVDRCGDHAQSYMYTEAIIACLAPDRSYRLHADHLSELPAEFKQVQVPAQSDIPPPHVRVSGIWNATENIDSPNSNIFGGFGTLTIDQTELLIPQAATTAAALAYYNARLFTVGDIVAFDTGKNLPVTITNMGLRYVPDFLHIEDKGRGSFIEHHDQPHLHMPLEESARGHILLGRVEDDDYLLSAFSIPYRQAIYIPPGVLHADPYLIGRYLVVYAVTENYSTVLFRSKQGEMVKTHIVKA